MLCPESHFINALMDCDPTASAEGGITDVMLTPDSNPPGFVWEEVKNDKYQTRVLVLLLKSIKITSYFVLCI